MIFIPCTICHIPSALCSLRTHHNRILMFMWSFGPLQEVKAESRGQVADLHCPGAGIEEYLSQGLPKPLPGRLRGVVLSSMRMCICVCIYPYACRHLHAK